LTHVDTISEDIVLSKISNSRFDKLNTFSYTAKVGNNLTGISPSLPEAAIVREISIVSAVRNPQQEVLVTTATPHEFHLNENVAIKGTTGVAVDGTFQIIEIVSSTEFKYIYGGPIGSATGGIATLERLGISNSGSTVFLTSAQVDTGIYGPYIWDPNSNYVLSSLTSSITQDIKAGNNVRVLTIDPVNNIPNEEGFVVFGFGTENEEGPVRYLYKPSDSSLQLDPAYFFKNNHNIGDGITVIRRKGAHVISSIGREYAPYITDTSVARDILQELLRQTKSVGIFIEFLVRYPQQLYSVLDVYRSDSEELWPVQQS
jgi:hypothetical protein